MKILDLPQGSAAWSAARGCRFGASEAAAMLDLPDAYESREQLLRRKKTGEQPPAGAFEQRLFAAGHEAEAAARALLEAERGLILAPIMGCHDADERISASFDGYDAFEGVIFEHKLFRDSAKAQQRFALAQNGQLGPVDRAQVQQQLMISGARLCLFVVSDGGAQNRAIAEIVPEPDFWPELISGWQRFAADLEAKQYTTDDSPDWAARMAHIRQLDEDIKRLSAEKKVALEALQSEMSSRAVDEIRGGGAVVRWASRKGAIDYGSIPVLASLDLEPYRKPPSRYLRIDF